jgi:hypothetical protein
LLQEKLKGDILIPGWVYMAQIWISMVPERVYVAAGWAFIAPGWVFMASGKSPRLLGESHGCLVSLQDSRASFHGSRVSLYELGWAFTVYSWSLQWKLREGEFCSSRPSVQSSRVSL